MSKRPQLPSQTTPGQPLFMRVLKHKDLLPEQHIVDTGYVDAQLLHNSQEDFGIDLVGPTRPNVKWQTQQQTGFDTSQFQLDWQAEQATCPEGQSSSSWTPPSTIVRTR